MLNVMYIENLSADKIKYAMWNIYYKNTLGPLWLTILSKWKLTGYLSYSNYDSLRGCQKCNPHKGEHLMGNQNLF